MNVKNIHRFVFCSLVIHNPIWYLRPTFERDVGVFKVRKIELKIHYLF